MLMQKTTCQSCGQSVAVVLLAPDPGSLTDYFAQIEIEAISDPLVGPDEPCPKCGTGLQKEGDPELHAYRSRLEVANPGWTAKVWRNPDGSLDYELD